MGKSSVGYTDIHIDPIRKFLVGKYEWGIGLGTFPLVKFIQIGVLDVVRSANP